MLKQRYANMRSLHNNASSFCFENDIKKPFSSFGAAMPAAVNGRTVNVTRIFPNAFAMLKLQPKYYARSQNASL